MLGWPVRKQDSLLIMAVRGFRHIQSTLAPGGGEGYSTLNFYTGRFRPEVRPLARLYTIFYEKGNPFVYLLLTNGTPFPHTLFRTLHPF